MNQITQHHNSFEASVTNSISSTVSKNLTFHQKRVRHLSTSPTWPTSVPQLLFCGEGWFLTGMNCTSRTFYSGPTLGERTWLNWTSSSLRWISLKNLFCYNAFLDLEDRRFHLQNALLFTSNIIIRQCLNTLIYGLVTDFIINMLIVNISKH